MLVTVKTEILVNTPWSATLAPCSVSRMLNKEETLGAAREKTYLNFSKGGLRYFRNLQSEIFEHNWFAYTKGILC